MDPLETTSGVEEARTRLPHRVGMSNRFRSEDGSGFRLGVLPYLWFSHDPVEGRKNRARIMNGRDTKVGDVGNRSILSENVGDVQWSKHALGAISLMGREQAVIANVYSAVQVPVSKAAGPGSPKLMNQGHEFIVRVITVIYGIRDTQQILSEQ